MTCTIHKYIMTVILAGAMILFMGITVQAVYAEDASTDEYIAVYEVEGMASNSCVLPGSIHNVHVELKTDYDGQAVDWPAGATCEWEYGIMEVNPRPDDFKLTVTGPQDATIEFPQMPDEWDDVIAWLTVTVKDADGKVIATSDTSQIGMMNEFYEVVQPYIDPFMMVGEVTTDQRLGVVHHYVSEGTAVAEPCDFEYAWRGDDIFDALSVKVGKTPDADGFYPVTITRRSTDAQLDFALTVRYGDPEESETINYWLAEFTTDLADCDIQIAKGSHFTTYEDSWCYIDDVDADPAKGVAESNIQITNSDLVQDFDPNLFEIGEVKKYEGYDEESWDDCWADTSFPLTFDPKGTVDRNGNPTDGTALYRFTVKAKDGSGWTGETDHMYLYVNSKYSLLNLEEYFVSSVEFTDLSKYLKTWTKEPYERYEVPKGTVSKKLAVKIGPDTLTVGDDKNVKARYVNDSTKKEYKSFPTVAGEYTLVLTGNDPYFGTDASTHLKIGMKNTLSVKGKTVKINTKGKKKVTKKKTYKVSKVLKVKKAKGTVTYKKLKGNKKITVAKNGKVTVKKGLKKGTYKIKVSAKAAGNAQYFPITKKTTFKIVVK